MLEVNTKTNFLTLLDNSESPILPKYFSSWKGLSVYANHMDNKKKNGQIAVKFIDGRKVVEEALKWKGKEFNVGQSAQCANFVREVLSEAGYTISVTKEPVDGYDTSESFANGFAGNDIGLQITDSKNLIPGDLVLFKNTYGDWPDGTITHVGIYTATDTFIHRPTSSKPVLENTLSTYGHFKEGRRLFLK